MPPTRLGDRLPDQVGHNDPLVQRWAPRRRHRGVTNLELSDSETPVLEQTYRELRLPLLRLAFMLTGSRETAEDLVQSAFTSAQPKWDVIDDPPAYLRRSVVNLAKDGHRREFRRRLRQRLEPEPVTQIAELDETWALVRGLPQTQRKVVVLHYYEDLSLVEIAHLLDRPASTVRSDLRRALARAPQGPAMKTDLELDRHLRRTLAAVAATVTDEPMRAPAPVKPSRRSRRILAGPGVVIAVVPLAAAAVVNFGPEYVDELRHRIRSSAAASTASATGSWTVGDAPAARAARPASS